MGVDMKNSAIKTLRNKKAYASIETVAFLFIITALTGYMFGMFGAIHSGILGSIAARSYAFETFEHRMDLTYLRGSKSAEKTDYSKLEYRVHGVGDAKLKDLGGSPLWWATERKITVGDALDGPNRNSAAHIKLQTGEKDREDIKVEYIWVKTLYGICLNASCGGIE